MNDLIKNIDTARHPLFQLSEADLNMVTAFILVSGSIKALSEQYGVSYPTMRQRLDSLIERLWALVEKKPADPLNDYLADMIAKGRLSVSDAKQLRELHRSALADRADH